MNYLSRQRRPDFRHLLGKLTAINEWIDRTLAERAGEAVPLGDLNFRRIPLFVSDRTLASVKVVVTDDAPRPPVEEFGFCGVDEQLDGIASGDLEMRGATLDQTCFVSPRCVADEQFPFHFVIHSLQWKYQGRETWLANYLFGVLTRGRAETRAEIQARKHQKRFARLAACSGAFDAEQAVGYELRMQSKLPGFPFR